MNQIVTAEQQVDAEFAAAMEEIDPTVAELARRRAQPTTQLGNLIAEARARIEDLRRQRDAHEAVGATKIAQVEATFEGLEVGRQRIIAQLHDQAAQIVALSKAESEELARRVAGIREETGRQTKAINRMLDAQGTLLRALDEGATE